MKIKENKNLVKLGKQMTKSTSYKIAIPEITKTKSKVKNNKEVARFMGWTNYFIDTTDWNVIMQVVDKIESIIEHAITIDNAVEISWWYSPKKTGTFKKGAGGGGGWTEKRNPFDSIFGKFNTIYVYYQKGITFKVKENELAETKIEAVLLACFRWIEWYNKTVKKSTKK